MFAAMARPVLLSLLLAVAPGSALACEFHGGPWGMAFARMMHAGPAGSAATADAQAQVPAQANDAALAVLREQFLKRFNVKVEGEPAAAPVAAAAMAASPETPAAGPPTAPTP